MFTILSVKQPLSKLDMEDATQSELGLAQMQAACQPKSQPQSRSQFDALKQLSPSQPLKPRKLELLAPAKNLEVGLAAIVAGADAVYIGGSGFGARAAAGNDVQDIACLCAFAHRFGARVYLTVNTLLYDNELTAVRQMIKQAVESGVDGLIIQDPAVLTFPEVQDVELHASTQLNINSLDKVDYCAALGMSQIVLPREFSLEHIRAVCAARPDMKFEVFVSGAMCVSVSGECFISEYMTKRSANRGACAQICRLPMDLYHEERKVSEINPKLSQSPQLLAHGHLLSMKDNLRLAQLDRLVEAGASSFKIEGRLKDREYVVNQVAAFRTRLDELIDTHPDLYAKASLGRLERSFTPDVAKTFNRGFTDAYLENDNSNLIESRTPKNFGQEVGTVRVVSSGAVGSVGKNGQTVLELTSNQDLQLSNGDSFTFFDAQGELRGFRASLVASNAADLPVARKTSGQKGQSSGLKGPGIKPGKSFQSARGNGKLSGKPVGKSGFAQNGWGKHGGAYGCVKVMERNADQNSALNNRASDKHTVSAMSADESKTLHVVRGAKAYLLIEQNLSDIKAGMVLYRNVDQAFIKQLKQPNALLRKVPVTAHVMFIAYEEAGPEFWDNRGFFNEILAANESLDAKEIPSADVFGPAAVNPVGVNPGVAGQAESLDATKSAVCYIAFQDEYGRTGGCARVFPLGDGEPLSREVMQGKLSKLGDKYLSLDKVEFSGDTSLACMPLSWFNEQRRESLALYLENAQQTRHAVIERAYQQLVRALKREDVVLADMRQQAMLTARYLDTFAGDKVYKRPQVWPKWPESVVDQRLILNHIAQQVLNSGQDEPLGVPRRVIAQAVMTCRNCLIKNHALCKKQGGKITGYYLVIGGQRFDIVTDCKRCLMYLLPHSAS